MITASHNPKQDNGIKFVEIYGTHMSKEMELVSTKFVNEENLENAVYTLISDFEKFFN